MTELAGDLLREDIEKAKVVIVTFLLLPARAAPRTLGPQSAENCLKCQSG